MRLFYILSYIFFRIKKDINNFTAGIKNQCAHKDRDNCNDHARPYRASCIIKERNYAKNSKNDSAYFIEGCNNTKC